MCTHRYAGRFNTLHMFPVSLEWLLQEQGDLGDWKPSLWFWKIFMAFCCQVSTDYMLGLSIWPSVRAIVLLDNSLPTGFYQPSWKHMRCLRCLRCWDKAMSRFECCSWILMQLDPRNATLTPALTFDGRSQSKLALQLGERQTDTLH